MAFSLTQTPAFQTLSPEVAEKLSPEAIERFNRLSCIAHLTMDFGRCLAQDLEEPANQQENALSEDEFCRLGLSIMRGLDFLARGLVDDLAPYLAACKAQNPSAASPLN